MLPLSEKALDDLIAEERAKGGAPLTDWDTLSVRLRAEGLIRSASAGARFQSRRWLQAAAGLLLLAGGTALGRYSSGAPIVPMAETAQQAGDDAPAIRVTENLPASENGVATLASEFGSVDEAWEALNRSGEEYQRASAFLSAHNGDVPMPRDPSTYRTRLTALDNVMTEMRSALQEAPHDPVINQYYLATVGAREATLRQLGTTLPAGTKLNRF